MRLWSLHPQYLDRQGLIALWREGLLAQKVLAGQTKGYRHHPQLIRFQQTANPLGAIGVYLIAVAVEAERRGYKFDKSKIKKTSRRQKKILVSRGQIRYEFAHLLKKLKVRSPRQFQKLVSAKKCLAHPSFYISPSLKIPSWERVAVKSQRTTTHRRTSQRS